MRPRTRARGGQAHRAPALRYALAALAAATLILVTIALAWSGSRAAAQNGPGEPTAQTDDSVPASRVTLIGSSPQEAPDETWGLGSSEEGAVTLVRYAAGSGWSLGGELLDNAGEPLTGFKLDQPGPNGPSPLAGQITPTGAGVLVGTVPGGVSSTPRDVVLVRDPGGSFKETAPLPGEGPAALAPGAALFAKANRAPLLSPLDEGGGHAGALLVPVSGTGEPEDVVLHWKGGEWSGEPIEVPAGGSGFHVVGIGASSPENAWLLGELGGGGYVLFRRHREGESARWQPVTSGPGAHPGEPLSVPLSGGGNAPFTVPNAPTVLTQLLTVTSEGVWVDGERGDVHSSTTMFLRPTGETSVAAVASWCPSTSGPAACDHELPEALPLAAMRSIAWSDSSTPFGQRVIAGFANGVSLRLDGSEFTRVLALGGSVAPNDVGGTYGAAFSNPREGWLGQAQLPVHLTLEPVASRLAPWPVSFRHALLAVAPQPGSPVGALTSEALAVGDRGEIARYEPGKGWMPESLLGGSGRPVEPAPLRAVAWPTPSDAYAVGDRGQMWLWRAETGLWEPDPAAPVDFQGNLLGIAFDPNDPERGYAVGEGGVLLGYGKEWTQEAVPPEAAGASFTSIAFAGSEAIVAYRKLPDPSRNRYVGGLLVNDGSGWRVDEGAAAVTGADVPEVVAGLPDGGAAFAANGPEPARVFERGAPGSPWQATATPLPGGREPGSLALFRENGEPRAIAAGSALSTFGVESVSSSPPGFPPPLIKPYPLETNPESGVLRQTPTGWSDEEHDLNNAHEPPGHYAFYDSVFQPDPVAAVLIDPTGTQGWAVGGFVEAEGKHGGVLDTADIDRYPADGASAPGVGQAPLASTGATFAIGGDAQCAAPCADRAGAGVGPDVWLSAALARAGSISGARAFLYTGPRVTSGATDGPPTVTIPYGREYARYAQLLGESPLPSYAVATGTDLDGGEGESLFEQAFANFSSPFGTGPAHEGLAPIRAAREECAPAAACPSYYAFDSSVGPKKEEAVRVIVLDDSTRVESTQQAWLSRELLAAAGAGEPAIVIGDVNLLPALASGEPSATETAHILLGLCGGESSTCVNGGARASAYFFDAPEENITRALRIGSASIPTFGSGTLGYVSFRKESKEFLGASGFLLASVNTASSSREAGNVAPVTVRLIPNIGELALEATDGTLLRRSTLSQFAGLARRPRAGNRSPNQQVEPETDPYIPIPSNCVGAACANGLLPEYAFSSSNTDIGDFVEPDPTSSAPNAISLGSNGKPIHDSASGLFCAYNAGTTIVTITAGGESASLPVTVQAGSVRQPCGTVPLSEPPVRASTDAPAPAPAPAGASPVLASVPLAVPSPPAPARPPARPAPPPHNNFFIAPAATAALPAFVPLPLPTPARPTPPSGTSPITSPVEVAEKEEEREEATEHVSNQAVAYDRREFEGEPLYVIAVAILAAFAGSALLRSSRRGRGRPRVAPATVTTMHTQRQLTRQRRRW